MESLVVDPCTALTFRARTWSEILRLTLTRPNTVESEFRSDDGEAELTKSDLFIYAKLAILLEYNYSTEIENCYKDMEYMSK
jgi:hypothetical protein